MEDKELMKHIKSLGLGSIKEYISWCKAHGVGQGLNKSSAQRLKELSILKEEQLSKAVALSKERLKPLDKRLEKLNQHATLSHEDTASFSYAFQEILRRLEPPKQKQFLNFLAPLGKKSKLLKSSEYHQALYQIFLYQNDFIRPLSEWVPKSKNVEKQFSQLLRHCFTNYAMPEFMDSAWLNVPARGTASPEISWFLWVAQGNNLRKAPTLPLVLTKQMTVWTLQAPKNYNWTQAFRYGQIMALGGDERLVESINQTFLGRQFAFPEQEIFWTSVIQFFIQNPLLDRFQVGPILDFLQNQRQVQPQLSIKGRNPQTLLEQVQNWHRTLQKVKSSSFVEWEPSGIPEFSKEELKHGQTETWTVSEMLNSRELTEDSKKMHHCVSSYIQSCVNKRCTIFSIRLNGQRVATIEVLPSANFGTIVQARERFNALLSEKTRQIMNEWAGNANLRIRC